MNEPLGKWTKITLAVFLCVVALVLLGNQDRMHIYSTYFRETSPQVQMRLGELSGDMDEAAIRKHFDDVPFKCHNEPLATTGLGDRLCYTNIDKADGLPAFTLVTFFKKGRLSHAVVQVPWWVHGSWRDRLVAQYGKANRAGVVSRLGGPVLRWPMPNGHLEYNRERSLNPLEWSAVFWTAGAGKS